MGQGNHDYKTLQTKVCYKIVERIYRRVLNGHGTKFGAIKIDLEENLIIDGNHRYIAYKLAGFEYEIKSYCKNLFEKPPYLNIENIKIDESSDWDLNNPKTMKFCNDDFLESYKKN